MSLSAHILAALKSGFFPPSELGPLKIYATIEDGRMAAVIEYSEEEYAVINTGMRDVDANLQVALAIRKIKEEVAKEIATAELFARNLDSFIKAHNKQE